MSTFCYGAKNGVQFSKRVIRANKDKQNTEIPA